MRGSDVKKSDPGHDVRGRVPVTVTPRAPRRPYLDNMERIANHTFSGRSVMRR